MTTNHVEKGHQILNENNYSTWSVRARGYLSSKNCWKAINPGYGTTAPADLSADDANTNAKALYLLQSIVSDNYIEDISDVLLAKEAWQILSDIHTKATPLNLVMTLKEMMNCEKKDSITMHDYIAQVQSINRKLVTGGLTIPENLMAMILLMNLPLERYGDFVRTTKVSSETTVAEIKASLLLEERRIVGVDSLGEETNKQTAMFVGRKQKKSYQQPEGQQTQKSQSYSHPRSNHQKSSDRDKKCFACNLWGHISRDCPNKPKRDEEKRSEAKKANCVTESQEDPLRVMCTVLSSTTAGLGSLDSEWYLDSCASNHFCPNKDKFEDLTEGNFGPVDVATGGSVQAKGKGSVRLTLPKEHGGSTVLFTDVLYVPDLQLNLLSVRKLESKGCEISFKNGKCLVSDKDGVFIEGWHKNDIYYFNTEDRTKNKACSTVSSDLWHMRYGHFGNIPDAVKGKKRKEAEQDVCQTCVEGKLKKSKFPLRPGQRTEKVLELIHTDVCQLQTKSLGDARYFVTFTDDFSRHVTAVPIKKKSEVFQVFLKYQAAVERLHGSKILSLQSDRGGEYLSKEFIGYLEKEGIQHRLSLARRSQQNGLAERQNQTLLNLVRCMIFQANLPGAFWAEALATACYLKNRSVSKALGGKIPIEVWRGRSLADEDYNRLRVFGCLAMAATTNPQKLEKRAEKCIFLGYEDNTKGYRLYSLERKSITLSRDVVFDERVFPYRAKTANAEGLIPCNEPTSVYALESDDSSDDAGTEPRTADDGTADGTASGESDEATRSEAAAAAADSDESDEAVNHGPAGEGAARHGPGGRGTADITADIGARTAGDIAVPGGAADGETSTLADDTDDSSSEEPLQDDDSDFEPRTATVRNQPAELRKSARTRKPKDCSCCNACNHKPVVNHTPRTPTEALRGPNATEWVSAMEQEMRQMSKNGAWTIVKRPAGKNVIGSMWVYCIKKDEKGNFVRCKARLVAQGHEQIPGVDYDKTYSPVVKRRSLRILMALAAENGWEVQHVDVMTAYLNSHLDDEVYMEQPPEFEEEGKPRKQYVCRLLKSIYGLHQAGRDWYAHIDNKMTSLGFRRCKSDPCIYRSANGKLIVAIYVDDLAIVGERGPISDFIRSISELLDVTDLGLASNVLSILIEQTPGEGTKMGLPTYTEAVLEDSRMKDTRPVSTPIMAQRAPGLQDEEKFSGEVYRRVVGKLLYIANATRPDISFAVCHHSQRNQDPKLKDWIEVKHTLRYLRGTTDLCLNYRKTGKPLQAYVDADWATDKMDRRSISGYVLLLAGGAVSWSARKQRSVATSTVEAEYVAMAEAAKEVLWMKKLLKEIGQERFAPDPIQILADNQGAIKVTTNVGMSDRLKHIDIKFHFLKQIVEEGRLEFNYVSSQCNVADILTKAVANSKHVADCVRGLGLR